MMKFVRVVLVILFSALVMGNTNSQIPLDKLLEKFRWEKRVLLIIADADNAKLVNGVAAFFDSKICQNKNRNLKLFKIIGDDLKKYKISERYTNKKGIWLIGYDGDDKAYSSDLSLLDRLYNIIDSMPIRKNEMLHEDSSCR